MEKDDFGITKKLRVAIDKKYEVIELVGNGSYGCVSQGKCKKTGRIVAMKIMKNQATMEYEIIKLLRELQIMRRLNIVSDKYFGKGTHPFVPELIDIITPESSIKMSSNKGSTTIDQFRELQSKSPEMDLTQICIVMEFIETDFDQLLKNRIDFSEHHLLKLIYNALMSVCFIHQANIMHRDIKPANILLSS